MIPEEVVADRLAAIGAPVHPGSIAAARTDLIRARAVGSSRAKRLFDDDVLNAPDPVRALLADLGEPTVEAASLLRRNGTSPTLPALSPASDGGQFLIYDSRRFCDVIEDVIVALKGENVWKEGFDQKRRIMKTFAWITGNRELGSYDHRDVAAFKAGLMRLPSAFWFGTLTKGAMARPFADVVAELPPIEPENRRINKTINRDLSTMSTVAKHLEQTAWKPRIPGAKVMDFRGATVAIKESDSSDLRPPWSTAHLKCLFSSRLYTGGGAGRRRLKEVEHGGQVWHDAAYFAPILWYYTHACREEICGLEVTDVTIEHPVPHIDISDNLTRGRDGEKRLARRRKLPIHPELNDPADEREGQDPGHSLDPIPRLLEEMARALFRSWFVDFDPVRAKMEGRDPALPAGAADLFPTRFGDDGLPEGWESSSIDDAFNVTMGQSPPGDTYNTTGDGMPFYQGRSDFGFRYPTRRVYCVASKRLACRDDTLLSVRAPVGDLNIAFEDCCVGRGVAALRHVSGSASFTYYALSVLKPEIAAYDDSGTVFGSIGKKQLGGIAFVAPDDRVIAAFDGLAGPVDARIRIALEQADTLAALRDTLLPKLISRELRISDAEALVEEAA